MRIGVFDSGIGGITVLTTLREMIPQAEYVYLGDNANLPYGTKSPAQVAKLSVACTERLLEREVDAIVVACNTASSLALDEVRAKAGNVPVYGVVKPGADAAWVEARLSQAGRPEAKRTTPILVLATRATIKSGAYREALEKTSGEKSALIYEQACPLLVPMIEEGWLDHTILQQTIDVYVGPYREKHPKGVALLGCTHYPWIQSAIEQALPGWSVVNSAQALGRMLELEFKARNLIPSTHPGGRMDWIFTDPDALPAFARQFIAVPAPQAG